MGEKRLGGTRTPGTKNLKLVGAVGRGDSKTPVPANYYDTNFAHWLAARYEQHLEELKDSTETPVDDASEADVRVLVFHDVENTQDRDVSKRLTPFTELAGKYLPMTKARSLDAELEKLQATSPWLEEAITSLRRSIWLSSNRSGASGFRLRRPLLLVGEPGIGKTWFAQMLPELLGIPFFTIAASGKADNMALKGTARGWNSARPGEVVQFIAEKKVANVFVVVDEIDKVSYASKNGSFPDTLLQLFEPENARQWRDEFLLGRVDLSHVNWVCTANSLESISEPLRSRMDIVRLRPPRNAAEKRIMLNQTARRLAQEYGMSADHSVAGDTGPVWPDFISDEEAITKIVRHVRTPRSARKILEGLLDLWMQHQVAQRCN